MVRGIFWCLLLFSQVWLQFSLSVVRMSVPTTISMKRRNGFTNIRVVCYWRLLKKSVSAMYTLTKETCFFCHQTRLTTQYGSQIRLALCWSRKDHRTRWTNWDGIVSIVAKRFMKFPFTAQTLEPKSKTQWTRSKTTRKLEFAEIVVRRVQLQLRRRTPKIRRISTILENDASLALAMNLACECDSVQLINPSKRALLYGQLSFGSALHSRSILILQEIFEIEPWKIRKPSFRNCTINLTL